MKRVLHVVTSLEQGGMENGVCNLAVGLLSHGIHTQIACLERKGAFEARLPQQIQIASLGKKNGFSLSTVWILMLKIRLERPDIVHTHNLGPLIYSSLATFGGKTCRIVHGEHSLLADWEKTPYRIRTRRLLYGACRFIHTVSQAQIPELISLLGVGPKLRAIPNGVDTDRFRPIQQDNLRGQFGLPHDAIVLGLVGRFGPYKQHDKLISAFELLAKTNNHLHLMFIGSGGDQEQRIRSLALASPFKNRIHIIGYLPDPLPGYNVLDLLIVPSTNEGMSNVAIEAMSCGIPVLANTNCGHEQIIDSGNNGIISDLSTASQIEYAIRSALESPDLTRKIRANARNAILNNFSINRMLLDYSKLYAECIKEM